MQVVGTVLPVSQVPSLESLRLTALLVLIPESMPRSTWRQCRRKIGEWVFYSLSFLINEFLTSRWLYTLFTSLDACFRVKRYDVSSEAKDPIIDDGLSYFVKDGPYKKVLAKYGDQNEVKFRNSQLFTAFSLTLDLYLHRTRGTRPCKY